ncbi:hypothetical protein INT45_002932 [Circinella minor]|uniref:Uncharacterized protein n=1 Tax=Circinella minor TaxID=1195481 RepID=A0A8H7VPV5_9FUNG|nr:hypothetical protein INT45_002932 [Circinella minor]
MKERTTILQAKFLLSTYYLPDDALLSLLIPYLNQHTKSKWHLLNNSTLWQQLPEPKNNTMTATFKATKRSYLMNELSQKINAPIGAINLAACRPKLVIDPILWLPMSRKERSRCIRWRLGWLPGGKIKACQTCGFENFHKNHAISCLNIHKRLEIPYHITSDPISHLLNQLPQSKPTSHKKINFWKNIWPTICTILVEIDAHQHPTSNQHQYFDEHPGKAFTTWIDNPSPHQNE